MSTIVCPTCDGERRLDDPRDPRRTPASCRRCEGLGEIEISDLDSTELHDARAYLPSEVVAAEIERRGCVGWIALERGGWALATAEEAAGAAPEDVRLTAPTA